MLKIMDFDPDCSLAFCCYSIKNKTGPEKIAISPSSSCSKFAVTRYFSRIIDMQPALIYGLFRKKLFAPEDLNLLGVNHNMRLRIVFDDMKPYLSRHRKIFNEKLEN